ncbi:MAG: cobalamin-dependent protein [Spongiibacteraceae bacterium]|jgi:hypothetical protein|nr:cobalamin-dependent protein [Spongiibacteraceae bacterium]
MDSDGFWAAPLTTGGLKAYHQQYGQRPCAIELVHFRDQSGIDAWRAQSLPALLQSCEQSLAAGGLPVIGFSMYTWNAAPFLALAREIKQACPGALLVAGGPHVQQAEDYLGSEAFDVIALGEGEASFSELLDAPDRDAWADVAGLAYLQHTAEGPVIHTTGERARTVALDELPSALDVVPLADSQGRPLYDSVAYETSRGCPFKCAFCEWGTGAIGTKMYQFSMARIRRDWEIIIAAGIRDMWLADSNFGALREDLDKARLICELKQRTGLPTSFATSWSKKHSPRVQDIVLLLHRHQLLPHYQLALQTLTPEALRLSNRQNMQANKYQPIAQQMAEAGVPIAAELIWGLPGDNLADFQRNLDTLLGQFPNINIFGYTLLPGTEFYRRRDEYRIETLPVAGYGKAKGEYVIGCHSFDREQGMAGYFLIAAHIVLVHGHVLPLTTRYLALLPGELPVSSLLCALLTDLVQAFRDALDDLDPRDCMAVYEARARIFLAILKDPARCYAVINQRLGDWLAEHGAPLSALAVPAIDQAFCPRYGQRHRASHALPCAATAVKTALDAMRLPDTSAFAGHAETLTVEYPGGVGDMIREPDAGGWVKGLVVDNRPAADSSSGTASTIAVVSVV